MKVKLRPGTHFAPVEQGVYFSRAGSSFVLTAPRALYGLLDAQVGLLSAGTDTDELVRVVGQESARAVLDRVLRTLVDQDVLIDLDALRTAAPDPRTAARHAEVLSYLEGRCADPYRVFARLRAAEVAVIGGGPALAVLRRTLGRYGVARVTDAPSPSADLLIAIDDADQPLDVPACAAAWSAIPLIPLYTGRTVAVVGSAIPGAAAGADRTDRVAAFGPAARRAGAWADTDPELAAPRPLSGVLAGSLAGHATLTHLVAKAAPELPPDAAGLTIVYGPDLATRHLPAPAAASATAGPAATTNSITATTAVIATADPAAATTNPLPQQHPGEPVPHAAAITNPAAVTDPATLTDPEADRDVTGADGVLTGWAELTARWTGPLSRGRDLDVDQMPMSLATVNLVVGGPDRVVGWGSDRARASLNAVLGAARLLAGPEEGATLAAGRAPRGTAATVVAAGVSPRRRWMDGVLRLLATDLPAETGREIGWADLTGTAHRTLWSICEDYFDRRLTVRATALTGTSAMLVTVTDETGEIAVAEWGLGLDQALHLALGAAAAHAQATPAVRAHLTGAPVGTQFLESGPAARLDTLAAELRARLDTEGRRVVLGEPPADPVLGCLPIAYGPVTLT